MFTDFFVKYLQKNGISAYRIAKETGISQGLMNEYKNGIKLPTIQNLVKIADYLGCSVDYLLGRTDNPEINRLPVSNNVVDLQNKYDEKDYDLVAFHTHKHVILEDDDTDQ